MKGKKVMIPQFISRLFAYDQYLKAFYCKALFEFPMVPLEEGRKGELCIITGKLCLALKLHLWFQLVKSQL